MVSLSAVFDQVYYILGDSLEILMPFMSIMISLLIIPKIIRVFFFDSYRGSSNVYHVEQNKKGDYILKEGPPPVEYDQYSGLPSLDENGSVQAPKKPVSVSLEKLGYSDKAIKQRQFKQASRASASSAKNLKSSSNNSSSNDFARTLNYIYDEVLDLDDYSSRSGGDSSEFQSNNDSSFTSDHSSSFD